MTKSRLSRFSAYRFTSILLVLCFVLLAFPAVFVESAQSMTVTAGSASGQYGDTVTVPISFQGVPSAGINNFDFKVRYNSSVLDFVKVSPGAIIKNSEANFAATNNVIASEITILFVDQTQADYPVKSNGVCANIEFKIKNGAPDGASLIELISTGNNTFCDVSMEPISVLYKSGDVTVENSGLPTPTGPVSPIISGDPGMLLPSGMASPSASVTPSATVTPSAVVTPTATSKQTTVTPQKTSVTRSESTPVKILTTPIVVIKENLPGNLPAGIPADLVINLSMDKRIYTESEVITYKIKYLNRLDKMAENITISADIPENTTLLDAAGGKTEGNKIVWTLESIPDRKVGEIVYKVKVGQLSEPQKVFSSTAVIESSDNVLINNDNKSVCLFMLYSGKLEQPKHIKYVGGYNDNTIKPDNYITRAEVAVMFAKILGLDVSDNTQVYNDVPKTHWACSYINAVSKAGLFKGYDGNLFKPNDKISRAELATAIFRNLKLKEVMPLETNFSDIIGHWSWGYVEEVYRLKLVNGYGKGQFAPNNKIKRCEVMTMLNRMAYRGPLKGADVSFGDLSKTHWAYGQIAEATCDHGYTISPDGYETALGSN